MVIRLAINTLRSVSSDIYVHPWMSRSPPLWASIIAAAQPHCGANWRRFFSMEECEHCVCPTALWGCSNCGADWGMNHGLSAPCADVWEMQQRLDSRRKKTKKKHSWCVLMNFVVLWDRNKFSICSDLNLYFCSWKRFIRLFMEAGHRLLFLLL